MREGSTSPWDSHVSCPGASGLPWLRRGREGDDEHEQACSKNSKIPEEAAAARIERRGSRIDDDNNIDQPKGCPLRPRQESPVFAADALFKRLTEQHAAEERRTASFSQERTRELTKKRRILFRNFYRSLRYPPCWQTSIVASELSIRALRESSLTPAY